MVGRWLVAGPVLACVLLLSGCGQAVPGKDVVARVPAADLALVREYVRALNAAGDDGPEAQAAFLRSTQEPGTRPPPDRCFGSVTLTTRLVERTLRPATDWTPPGVPPGTRPPEGAVYVVASGVTASRDRVTLREDVGSKHLVVRNGRVYGYAPCPN